MAATSRRTARLRLTLLYGGLFLLSGAVLLAITYLLVRASDRQSGSAAPLIIQGCDVADLDHRRQRSGVRPCGHDRAGTQRTSDLHHLLINSGIALAIVAVLALVLGWYVAGRVLRPVRTITATARRISASNLHERLALDGADDEFKELGDTLDDLFARLEASFDAQRHFVANASHELRTPLTADRDPAPARPRRPRHHRRDLALHQPRVLASNREQERLIDALLALASSEGGLDHRERIDLPRSATASCARRELDADARDCTSRPRSAPPPSTATPGSSSGWSPTWSTTPSATTWSAATSRSPPPSPTAEPCCSVTNTGPVIPPSDIDRLFQPFQRLDPRRTHHKDGHGLGLSIVRAIATAHGATITARPEPKAASPSASPSRQNSSHSHRSEPNGRIPPNPSSIH